MCVLISFYIRCPLLHCQGKFGGIQGWFQEVPFAATLNDGGAVLSVSVNFIQNSDNTCVYSPYAFIHCMCTQNLRNIMIYQISVLQYRGEFESVLWLCVRQWWCLQESSSKRITGRRKERRYCWNFCWNSFKFPCRVQSFQSSQSSGDLDSWSPSR